MTKKIWSNNGGVELSNPKYPILVTRDLIIFPNNSIPLTVASRRNRKALETALNGDANILAIPVAGNSKTGTAKPEDIHSYGTRCHVEKMETKDDSFKVVLTGIDRVSIEETQYATDESDLLVASYDTIETVEDLDPATSKELLKQGTDLALEILKMSQSDGSKKLSQVVKDIEDPDFFIHLCASNLDLTLDSKLALIETASLAERMQSVLELLAKRRNSLQVQIDIGHKLSGQLDRKQREMILREQLQTIREELGEFTEFPDQDYMSKIEESQMPEEAKEIARGEARRLESTPSASPEAPNIRNYLDTLIDLPWGEPKHEDIDIQEARKILDDEHYGLPKVKDRIIQHLAVTQLNKGQKGFILLLLGPPGVGKTSLGRSIAKGMNREFVRISLGGVRDEAEIRGHRRTYLGSMPGRIIKAIKRSGVRNPVFLLDEIDKLSSGWGGDPASALLEALDPEQNHNFEDHYLEVPFDLSNVVFIATANSIDNIPHALRDRLEIIELSGYTTEEKFHIGQQHLWSEQLIHHGLESYGLKIEEEALQHLIQRYTKESGVRELKRKIAAICRKLAEKVLTSDAKEHPPVNVESLEEALGREIYNPEEAGEQLPEGVVTGLAWTPMGGEILYIESKLMPGKGKLTITGQLGDVMKESLQIALSLVRSQLHKIDSDFQNDQYDIHVHVPAGAIPKDGPSAGITMLCSILSMITHRKVSPKLAMSGELSLRGTVMPVGGIKEKVIAAHRAGIREVILSEKNQKDLKDVPQNLLDSMDIHLVKTVEDVVRHAFDLDLELSEVIPSRVYHHQQQALLS